jgi:hypothetical protein
VNRGRLDLLGEPKKLLLGRAVPQYQGGPSRAKRCAEVREALEQELGPRTGGVAAVQQAVVEAEDRDHAVVAVERRAKRWVIVQPQVAAKPDECRQGRTTMPRPGSMPVSLAIRARADALTWIA